MKKIIIVSTAICLLNIVANAQVKKAIYTKLNTQIKFLN